MYSRESEMETETKSSYWKTGVHWSKHPSQDEVQSHRSNSGVVLYPAHLVAELTNQYNRSLQLFHRVSFVQLQATPLQRSTRRSKPYSQAPSVASSLPQRGILKLVSGHWLILGKLFSFLSVYTNIGSSSCLAHSFFAILRFCDIIFVSRTSNLKAVIYTIMYPNQRIFRHSRTRYSANKLSVVIAAASQ